MKKFIYKKNDIAELYVDSINTEFEGIISFSDKKLIVPFVLPQEKVKVKIVKIQKNTAFAILLQVLVPSDDRNLEASAGEREVNELNYIKYSSQLNFKKKILQTLFKENFPVSKFEFFASKKTAYRNKINLPVQFDSKNRKYLIGTYQKRSHRICDFDGDNPALTVEMNKFIQDLKQILHKKNYTQENHIRIKSIFIRGTKDDGYQGGVVLADKYDPRLLPVMEDILQQNSCLLSFFYAVTKDKGNSLLIKEPVFITEQEYIEMTLLNKKYKVSPESFFQLNSQVTEDILKYMQNYFSDKNLVTVNDIFSGVGVLSDHFNDKNIHRTCIELNEKSFNFADKSSADFICCDMSGGDLQLSSEEKPDLFIFDPPRKGIGENSIKIIKKYLPNYIVYLSCNPHSQKKDLAEILNMYEIDKLAGFDMFPFTKHIESFVILRIKKQEK